MERQNRSIIGILVAVLIAAGVALAASQGGYEINGVPLFALCAMIAFGIQWAVFIPSYLRRTEKFYDISGTITYLAVLAVAVGLNPSVDARAWLMVGLVSIWSVRLGSFLFRRITAEGEDRRFREIKKSFFRFLLAWTLQALWVVLSLAAALAAITSETKIPLDAFALIGGLVWLFGFGFEVAADRQKSKFKADPANKDKFIRTGLWAWSRHPNYFGEIVLWIGIAIIALPVLSGWQWVTMISPVFIVVLLTRISGIPMLEARSDDRWGGQPEYESYKAQTPILIPKPPAKK